MNEFLSFGAWMLVAVVVAVVMCLPMLVVAKADYEKNRCGRCGKSDGEGGYRRWCPTCRQDKDSR